jgi:hypothetical protein
MESSDEEIGSWLEREVAGCQFQDVRHGKRFRTLLGQLSEQIGGSIPFACQDWAATKAAYRFLSNPRVDEGKILAGHFLCTRQRFAATAADSPVLMLHDTTEFSYQRENPEAIGVLKKMKTMYASKGQPGYHTTCGILMHSSLVVTTGGLPLGLAAIKFWTRDKFHGANALKRKINPTRVPIEQRELSVAGEREAVHGLACRARAGGSHRRSGERHLRAFLYGPRCRHSLPAEDLRRPARRRRRSYRRR